MLPYLYLRMLKSLSRMRPCSGGGIKLKMPGETLVTLLLGWIRLSK